MKKGILKAYYIDTEPYKIIPSYLKSFLLIIESRFLFIKYTAIHPVVLCAELANKLNIYKNQKVEYAKKYIKFFTGEEGLWS